MPCFLEILRAAAAEGRTTKPPNDPAGWATKLRNCRGQVGHDGLERITTERLFDLLEAPRHHRTPEAAKKLKDVMLGLDWTAVRVSAPTARGRAARVRGYCRTAK